MDFSLGGNPLENYISHIPIPPVTSDSIRSLQDLQALDLYFHSKKTSISSSLEQLWQRIAQCEGRCMQLSSSVDLSYSRINGEDGIPQRGLNIERYEDLLPVSFKEVEWTRSSRVHVQEDQERMRIIERYEREVENYQKRVEANRQEQTKLLGDIENAFLDQMADYHSVMEGRQRAYEGSLDKLGMRLQEIGKEMESQVEGVGAQLDGTYALLSKMISARLDGIQQEMASLGV